MYDIIRMLSEFGGLAVSVTRFVGLFFVFTNEKLFLGKLISEMYMVKLGFSQVNDKVVARKSHGIGGSPSIRVLKYGFLDVFNLIR